MPRSLASRSCSHSRRRTGAPAALADPIELLAIKCITPQQAGAINYRVLLTTCCSFGLGSALSNTHVSAVIAAGLAAVGSKGGPLLYLFAIFFLASLLSCVVSNSATVVLLYHVVRSVRVPGIVPAQPLLALMIGGSCAFATPIGYQTNLMVLTRGNYRFSDLAAWRAAHSGRRATACSTSTRWQACSRRPPLVPYYGHHRALDIKLLMWRRAVFSRWRWRFLWIRSLW